MQQASHNSLTLVLGGVRSGKSRYAQALAERYARVTFVATAEPREDVEMRAKIDRHRADRPAVWKTVEAPLHLAQALQAAAADSDAVLVDCLTLFASNLLESTAERAVQQVAIDHLCITLKAMPCPVILVSNEVGSGVVPAYASGRRFRDLVGEINQQVAAAAGTVLLLIAGLPFALKGEVTR